MSKPEESIENIIYRVGNMMEHDDDIEYKQGNKQRFAKWCHELIKHIYKLSTQKELLNCTIGSRDYQITKLKQSLKNLNTKHQGKCVYIKALEDHIETVRILTRREP